MIDAFAQTCTCKTGHGTNRGASIVLRPSDSKLVSATKVSELSRPTRISRIAKHVFVPTYGSACPNGRPSLCLVNSFGDQLTSTSPKGIKTFRRRFPYAQNNTYHLFLCTVKRSCPRHSERPTNEAKRYNWKNKRSESPQQVKSNKCTLEYVPRGAAADG